jgi:hypothetical protein
MLQEKHTYRIEVLGVDDQFLDPYKEEKQEITIVYRKGEKDCLVSCTIEGTRIITPFSKDPCEEQEWHITVSDLCNNYEEGEAVVLLTFYEKKLIKEIYCYFYNHYGLEEH